MAREADQAATAGAQADAPFIMFHVPDDRALLAAVGAVALHHAHLDHSLKLMIKTLANVSHAVALADTEFEGSASSPSSARR